MACVALNQLLPRYIRHDVDFSFYLSEAERQENLRQIEDSVTKAWAYVLERKKRF
ncbi:MAG: late competence development ComFB family protein [Burkholderiales bacterium]